MNNVVWTNQFVRAFKKVVKNQPKVKIKIYQTLKLLENNIFDEKLATHKLKGKHSDKYSISVEFDLRIIFKIDKDSGKITILLITVGNHDDVY